MDSTLVIFSGLPGTGKSMLADRLARELQWPLLRIDDVIGDVPENAGVAFWDSKVAVLLGMTKTQLSLGLSVIVDSVFMNLDRVHARNIARENRARFRPVYLFVSDDAVWMQRVTARHAGSGDRGVASWEQVQRQRGHFRPWEPGTAIFIDSLEPFDRNYEMVRNFVSADDVDLKPLPEIPVVEGRYHG